MQEGENSKDRCREEITATQNHRSRLPFLVDRIVAQYDKKGRLHHVGPEPIPSRRAIIDIIRKTIPILFPGFFAEKRLDEINHRYYLGEQVTELFDAIATQIQHAIRHDCIRFNRPCVHCEDLSQEITLRFIENIPELQETLSKDVRAAFEGDPASRHFDEIIFCYPGLFAVAVYRVAH
ncbi:MAG TPA: hypothetical protein PKJ17_10845, partial [Syntrophorhabdaceae bacterium]|nr:hypothetical protein [Syntrophorhabdaceae bacterium]